MGLLSESDTNGSYVIIIEVDDDEHQVYIPKYIADEVCAIGEWYMYYRLKDKNSGSGHQYGSVLDAE